MNLRAERMKEEAPIYIEQQLAKLKEDPLDMQTLNETLKQYKNFYSYVKSRDLK